MQLLKETEVGKSHLPHLEAPGSEPVEGAPEGPCFSFAQGADEFPDDTDLSDGRVVACTGSEIGQCSALQGKVPLVGAGQDSHDAGHLLRRAGHEAQTFHRRHQADQAGP